MKETHPSSHLKAWMPIAIYIVIIFALTPFLPKITKQAAGLVNLTTRQFDIWIRNIVLVGLPLSLIAIMIQQGRYKEQSTYFALAIIFACGAGLVGNLGAPVEATHFLEYGGLAVFSFYKLRRRYKDMRSGPLYLAAGILTVVVGGLDELYQGWLPARYTRYYDFNDIFLNAASGVLGLIYVWGVMRPGPLNQRINSIFKGGRKGSFSKAP